jgi:hypothetical protein
LFWFQVPGLPGNFSLGEAWPEARVRILTPKHMVFDNTSLVTNYTSGPAANNLTVVAYNSSTSVIDLFFPVGILFVDIISLNFSMKIDPNTVRPIGKGNENSTVVMFPICRQWQYFNYPTNTSDYIACGGMASTTLIANVPGKIISAFIQSVSQI